MPRSKKLGHVTIASVALNFGLVAFLLLSKPRGSPVEGPGPIPPHAAYPKGSDTIQSASRPVPDSTDTAIAIDWKTRLQQGDIPRHVLVAAIQADFHANWDRREDDLRKQYTDGKIEVGDLALFSLDREIALEATIREALGERAFREWDGKRKIFDIDTGALALGDDEANKLHSLRASTTERLRALERAKLKNEIGPADYDERHELAQADYEQALKDLIGSQRFNDARGSGLPAYLRRDLRGLGISEAQLAQIQNVEGTFGEGRADLHAAANSGAIDNVKLDQENDALNQLRDEQLHQILGEEAYSLYRRQQDPRYQTMNDFANTWQLTRQDVENVFQLFLANDTETRRIKLADYAAGIPPDETEKKVSALQAKFHESINQTLSPEQLEKLRRNGIIAL